MRSRKQFNPMATINPAQYVREVIGEVTKVTWPTKKETTVTTIMVIIMVALAAILFMVVDFGLAWAMRTVLGMGRVGHGYALVSAARLRRTREEGGRGSP